MLYRRLAVLAFALLAACPLLADNFTLIMGGSWSNSAIWLQNGLPATRTPGSLAGTTDTVSITVLTYVVTVDSALAEPVTLSTTCPSNTSTCRVDVTAGGLLRLTGTSNIGADARLRINGGTVDNVGTLNLAGSSHLDFLTGTLQGAGTTGVQAGANVNATGSGGAMTVGSSQIVTLFGTLTYSGGSLAMNGGSTAHVKSGGIFDIQTINGITTNSPGASKITVYFGGTFRKTAGAFGTNIDVPVDNDGLVQVTTGALVLVNGSHTGVFDMTTAATGIEFNGSHSFSGTGAAIQGAGEALFRAMTFQAGSDVDASNINMDSFGSIGGSGTLNVSGLWRWRGSAVSGVTVNMQSGSTLNVTGEGNTALNANAHINNLGTINISPGVGSLSINSGAHITNDGDLNLLGDVTVGSDGLASARIDNFAFGTLDKTGGASNAFLNVAVNNSGAIGVTSGVLKLAGGGTHTGSFFTGTTTGLSFAGGTHTFNPGTAFSGTGTVAVSSGVADFDTNVAIGGTLSFQLLGGVVTGSGNLSIAGTFLWSGGAMNDSSGPGQTILSGNSSSTPTTTAITLSGRTLSHIGTFTYNPSAGNYLTIDNGGQFLNNGTFHLSGDVVINSNNVTSPRFTNGGSGTLNKTTGAGTAQFLVYYSGDGTINLSSGTITLSRGGQNLGAVNFSNATNKIVIDNSVFGFSTAPAFTGSGYLTVTGASARLALLVPVAVENLEFLSGQIDGSTLTIGTVLIWKSGTMLGPGITNLTSATLDHGAPTGATLLDARQLDLDSSVFTYAANGFGLTLRNGATINNNSGSTFDSIDAGNILSGGTGTNSFNNMTGALLKKSAGASGTRVDVVLNNLGGTISSEAGGQSLIVNGGGSMSGGVLTTSAGAFLDFFGGTFGYTGGGITGSGTLRVLGTAVLDFSNSVAAPTTFQLDSGGIINVASTKVLAVDTFNWNGGTVQGGGQLRTLAGTISNVAPTTLGSPTIFEAMQSYTYAADSTNYLTVNGTLLVGNSGILQLSTDAPIGGGGQLQNDNIVRKTGGAGVSSLNLVVSSSGGTIETQTGGTLRFNGGGILSNTLLGTGSGTIEFAGAVTQVGTGSSIGGTGTILISGGTALFHVSVTAPRLELTGGFLGGGGAMAVNGGKWSGGDMNVGGAVTINTGATFELATGTTKNLGRPLVNNGTLFTQNLPAALKLLSGGSVTNNNLVELQENTNFFCTSCGAFTNASGATLRQFNAAGTSNFLSPFHNDGTVAVDTGILNLLGDGIHTGAFNGIDNTYLAFDGGNQQFSGTTSISSSGAVGFVADTSTFGGTYNVSGATALTVIDGAATFNSPSTIATSALEIRSGSLGGSSNVTVSGGPMASSWQAGTIAGSGAFTIGSGTTFDLTASNGAIALDGRTLTNNGMLLWSSAAFPFSLNNGATIQNNGTFTIASDQDIQPGPGTNTIVNAALFETVAPATSLQIHPAFTTSSTVNLRSAVTFAGGFTQTAGTTTLINATLAAFSNILLNGGTLKGNGTLDGTVVNGATIAPGASPGTINILGGYTQTPSGTLLIELGGTTPGTGYDQLAVTGSASLDGTLTATLFGGFTPADNDVFDVVTFTSGSTGTFATENLPAFPNGGTVTSSYRPNEYRLTAVVTQADLNIAQTTSGTTLHGQNATFTVTVTNLGPDATSGVVVTDNLTGGSLVSATSTVGSCTTGSPIVCTVGTLASNQNAVITIVVNASSIGTISNSASVVANEYDPNNGNNATGTASVTVVAAADLDVAVSESADPVGGGTSMQYTVTLVNGGPDNAASFNLALSLSAGSITAVNGGTLSCSGSGASASCTSASLAPGTYPVVVTVTAPTSGNVMSFTATASSTTGDPNTANNTQTENTAVDAQTDLEITKSGPETLTAGGSVTYTIKVKNYGPSVATNVVVTDPTPNRLTFDSNGGDCTTSFPCSLGNLSPGQSKTIFATYDVDNGTDGQPVTNVATVTSTATDGNASNDSARTTARIGCSNSAPSNLQPSDNATAPASGTLRWNGNGDDYTVFLGPVGTGCSTSFNIASTESLAYSLPGGTEYEWRVESRRGACGVQTSACVRFKTEAGCINPVAPLASVVGQTTSAKTYTVEWEAVPGATRYEIDEATLADFSNAITQSVTKTSVDFKHSVVAGTAYYYRVRAFNDCSEEAGPYSPTVRVVIVPVAPANRPNRNVNVPFGTTEQIVQQVFIPGEEGVTLQYSATTDRPWLTVRPPSGALPPSGVTLEVVADPRTLPNGTFTSTVIVTIVSPDSSGAVSHGTVVAGIPISISLVTPVTPVTAKEAASQHAMIIPTVGHLGGINSHWQSDVRITNAGFSSYRYRLTFTPAGGTAQGVKETEITVDAGATTALDDIISNWYGLGTLGDGASGMLEILPLDEPEVASLATVASSRTYNVTDNGTLGQFIPALRMNSFIGRALEGALPQILSLQQIAQSAAYRTNVGVAEASGNPVSMMLRVFNGAGTNLLDLPVQLAAGEQRQLNSLLAQHGITATDARIEATVIDGGGKVTAYASVVDNHTLDPLAVSGTLLSQSTASRFVLPGVANLDNPSAHWRTDMRVFNYGNATQSALLTFYPFASGAPRSQSVDLMPGAVLTLDNVVRSLFGAENAGGIIHIATPQPANLVVTGRTYNDTGNGTFGQFIPAVTEEQATGRGGRTLHVLQVEDSSRYRTNLGIAEVTGKPVTVEVQVVLPDSKVTPTVQIPLAANEFRQFAIIREMGVGNVYNGRITIRVIDGEGRVTAYGSVIDELTQDPTYVPAQ